MSVVGIDFGNSTCKIGVVKSGGVEIAINEVSNRETPTMVGYGPEDRRLGERAKSTMMNNYKNTVTDVKQLLGRQMDHPDVQALLPRLMYKTVEGPNGEVMVEVAYGEGTEVLSPTMVTAALFSQLKEIAENELNLKVVDCVISIPLFMTEKERYAVINAAQIAGLNALRLLHHTTATAIAYGFYATDVTDGEERNILFMDMGHASFSCSLVKFTKDRLDVVATAHDRTLGGQQFDQVLFEHLQEVFSKQYSLDIAGNKKAQLRLARATEKAKKVLTTNPEASVSVECIMNDVDVRGRVAREDFEAMCAPLLDRVLVPVQACLEAAGMTADDLFAAELVGGASRVRAVKEMLREQFGEKFGQHLNASESVAKGATLMCAMMSPTIRLRDYKVVDAQPYPIVIHWNVDGADDASELFPLYSAMPSTKVMTFYRGDTFAIEGMYGETNALPEGTNRLLTQLTVSGFPDRVTEVVKVKVKLRLDPSGLLICTRAHFSEEVTYQEEVDAAEAAAAAADGGDATGDVAPMDAAPTTGGDADMPDAAADGEATEKVTVTKTKSVKVDLNHESETTSLTPPELSEAMSRTAAMAEKDRVIRETAETRNAVETYCYEMRERVEGRLKDFMADADRTAFVDLLRETGDWLYTEESDEASLEVFQAKLKTMTDIGDPVERRAREVEEIGAAVRSLRDAIARYREMAATTEEKYAHIVEEERAKVATACDENDAWLSGMEEQQGGLDNTVPRVLHPGEVRDRVRMLEIKCNAIMNRPKPKPKVETPPPAADEGTSDGADAAGADGGDGAAGDADGAATPDGGPSPTVPAMDLD